MKNAEESESARSREVAELTDKVGRMSIEVQNKELAVKKAYETTFPDADYEWFARRLKWDEAASQPVSDLEESEDEGEEEEEAADATPTDAA